MVKFQPVDKAVPLESPQISKASEPLALCYLKFQTSGDVEAFATIVRNFSTPLLNFFYCKCWDKILAEDLVQDTFYKLLRTKATYEPTSPFKVYLLQVARNIWIDYSRFAISRRIPHALGHDEDSNFKIENSVIDSKPLPPLERMQADEEKSMLRNALCKLTDKLRDVVELGIYQELSYSEIGAVLRIPEGTVKSRMHLATQRLRTYMRSDRRKIGVA